jgi:hypothetical protein
MPAFPAQWFTAYSALSPVSGLFSHRPPGLLSRGLIPASGDRDHTISPSASVRFVAAHSHVHRSPHPTLVTIRSVPLDEARDGRMTSAFFTSEKEKYFLRRGLTRIREISSSGKSVRRIFLELQEVVGLNQLATAIVDARVVEKKQSSGLRNPDGPPLPSPPDVLLICQ